VLCAPLGAHAQTENASAVEFTRILGAEDTEVIVPKAVLPLSRKDAAALQEIIDFLKATNGTNWSGMQASGTLTSPSGDSEAQSPATLTIQNGDAFRLDVNAPEGQRSIRIQGSYGQILESDGVKHSLPVVTARGGLFAFSRLMAATFPGAQTSILDQGTLSIDGKALHRITIEEPAFSGGTPASADQVSAVDLYFDSATHLLIKSVASVQIDSADRARYVQAVTYGDYRKVDNVLLPFAYHKTLNGQRQWALQLTDIQLKSSVNTSYFHF